MMQKSLSLFDQCLSIFIIIVTIFLLVFFSGVLGRVYCLRDLVVLDVLILWLVE